MSCQLIKEAMQMDQLKFFLESSTTARLADNRVRIVRESNPREPQFNEDLVFAVATSKKSIPEDSLYTWQFDFDGKRDPLYFYATALRCRKMIADDPSYWTHEKLVWFAEQEKKLYKDWWEGNVYGIVFEEWNPKQRKFETSKKLISNWGIYGEDALVDVLNDYNDVKSGKFIICVGDDVKGDFVNSTKIDLEA